MNSGEAIDLGREALMLTLVVSLPVLLTALAVGLLVALFQAATQIQEHTLSFVPKIAAVLIAAAIAGPWMTERVVEFARTMFTLPTPMP